jgi:hypothetical protein
MKCIHVGEGKDLIPLPVQVPWGSSDDQLATIVLESSKEEDEGCPGPNPEERVIFIMSYFHFYLSPF